MALKVGKADIQLKKQKIIEAEIVNNNKTGIQSTRQIIGDISSVLRQAGSLWEDIRKTAELLPNKIKDRIPGMQQQQTTTKVENVAPAQRAPVQKQTEVIKLQDQPSTDKKIQRAEQIFKELHELIKPKIPFLKMVSALQIFTEAMKPENKKKIIAEIAKRL